MGDLGSGYPIQIHTEETREMQLKWIAVRKQEAKSKIAHTKQAIEDLLKGKVVDLEREILHAQQTLSQLEKAEIDLKSK
jgi:hypothetical protein